MISPASDPGTMQEIQDILRRNQELVSSRSVCGHGDARD